MNPETKQMSSRPLGVAAAISGREINDDYMRSKVVAITGDRATLSADNGHWCLLDGLSLLARLFVRVVVILPEGLDDLRNYVDGFTKTWCFSKIEIRQSSRQINASEFDAILHIGPRDAAAQNVVAINSNGWIARIARGNASGDLPEDTTQSNPIAALMAASLGAAEVFKILIGAPKDTVPLASISQLSLYDYWIADPRPGPILPQTIEIPNTLLAGSGAIGNGIVLLLSRLPLQGRLHIIDKQDFADENVGTCVLLDDPGWIERPKSECLANWLKAKTLLEVSAEKVAIETLTRNQERLRQSFDLVINGLDKVSARRAAQDLWPTVIVDGGINEFGAAVTHFNVNWDDGACLKCWFQNTAIDDQKELSRITGIPSNLLEDMDRTLSDHELSLVDERKREWVGKRVRHGKNLCSIMSEAAMLAGLGVEVEDGFEPSVPFVATASAAMVMAEVIKSTAFQGQAAVQMFKMVSLFHRVDETCVRLKRAPRAGCQCDTLRPVLRDLAKERAK